MLLDYVDNFFGKIKKITLLLIKENIYFIRKLKKNIKFY